MIIIITVARVIMATTKCYYMIGKASIGLAKFLYEAVTDFTVSK